MEKIRKLRHVLSNTCQEVSYAQSGRDPSQSSLAAIPYLFSPGKNCGNRRRVVDAFLRPYHFLTLPEISPSLICFSSLVRSFSRCWSMSDGLGPAKHWRPPPMAQPSRPTALPPWTLGRRSSIDRPRPDKNSCLHLQLRSTACCGDRHHVPNRRLSAER
jgi:hypothetical protein